MDKECQQAKKALGNLVINPWQGIVPVTVINISYCILHWLGIKNTKNQMFLFQRKNG